MFKKLGVDIGIFATNEEANIEAAIVSIQRSVTHTVTIQHIVVVSSGSFDHTNQIVRSLARTDKRIRLIDQAERKGKSSAINQFIRVGKAPYLITLSADLKVAKDAVEEICLPFLNADIGMVGAHPVPRNTRTSSLGKEIQLLWELHHEISLIHPKCGEMVAFRNVIREIPVDSAVDEATIEVLLTLIGYRVFYAPKAIVYNKGPKNLHEFFIQRRRVYTGHQWVYAKYQYRVVTMMPVTLLRVVLRKLWNKPQFIQPLFQLVGLEMIARFLGWIDYHVMGRNPYIWRMISR